MWDWAVWAGLAAGALAALGGLVFAVVRALQAWRDFKRLRRHVARGLGRIADAADETVAALEAAADTAELDASLARLRVALRRFAILRAALDEATGAFARVAAVYPRK